MRTLAASQNALAVVLLAAALPSSSAPAAPAPPDKAAAVDSVPKPREGLDHVVTLPIDKQSLGAAVAQVGEKAKLDIVLDVPAVTAWLGGAADSTPVGPRTDLKGVKARTALHALLDPYGLTFVVLGDSILVTTEDGAAARQMDQRVGVHLDKVELAAALKQLSRDAGVNLPLDPRADKEAGTRVSLDVEDVPLETAVRLLAEMAGLKPVRVGNTLFVTRKEVATAMRADPDLNPPRQVAVIEDRDALINALVWQVQQGRVQRQVIALPAAGVGSAPVKQIEGPAPANPDSAPAPEKKDGDK